MDYSANLIIDGIYLGEYALELNYMRKFIHDNDITSVLSVFDSPPIENIAPNYLYVYCEDDENDENMESRLDDMYEFLEKAVQRREKILVHCHAGISRSATVVIYYIMKTYRKSFKDAFNMVNEKRSIWPNDHFKRILKKKINK
ncbi:ptp [Cryptophlebia peltastica nucleopolyhedrovirus]|uniref:Ptp n=1 Tax=Cryptophlebia peltastica nucleopolyhedrovirus TaxID=2304025 RepID=A0A346RNX1_9ABAC|nr:ptp [Cryptophlebia peltastica nucleopolyhedrovirus]AXS67768.1 ptp [Cryptophlebia peltastica nucleopolyhedrovirus]